MFVDTKSLPCPRMISKCPWSQITTERVIWPSPMFQYPSHILLAIFFMSSNAVSLFFVFHFPCLQLFSCFFIDYVLYVITSSFSINVLSSILLHQTCLHSVIVKSSTFPWSSSICSSRKIEVTTSKNPQSYVDMRFDFFILLTSIYVFKILHKILPSGVLSKYLISKL